ncbi:hypothetical protein C8F01DRAFT_1167303 [Mycena amicta]|nr:hypothetical protein C8F01DRAFT_1167303 [Mycena amicta]
MSASVPNGPLPHITAHSFDNTPRPGGFGEASGSRDQEVVRDSIDVGDRMRILVAGRPSAGKTTLLRRVCGTSYQSGSNEIEIELSHPLFIFHDSAGFGGNSGVKVTYSPFSPQPTSRRYCIRTDTNRYLSPGDEYFFNDNVARDVPVIVVFTRYSGLVSFAYGELRATLGRVESKEKRYDKARELLRSRYIEPLEAMAFPPLAFVRLGDLLDDDTSFEELIETTLRLLSGNTLKPMIISVRQNNLDLCMERAVYEGLDAKDLAALLSHVLPHYPHIWRVSLSLFLSDTS